MFDEPLTRLQVVAFCGSRAVPIDSSLEDGVFEPEATEAMGEAFEAACKRLRDAGRYEMVRKIVAQRIIAAARSGELDPVRLRTVALGWISIAQVSPAA
jgi:hypothetical protein